MQDMHLKEETIAAISTPPGSGAIGIIRISGPDAIAIANKLFSKDIAAAKGYSIHFGQFIKTDRSVLDEVLLTIFRAPRSFTREDVVEISFHGSPYILTEALNELVEAGARPALAGEFTQRAFLNGAMDLAQAEAVADLIASSTSGEHRLALRQMKGGVSDEIKKLREELLNLTSLLELELDFSEEDVEFADRDQLLSLIGKITAMAEKLADSFRLGNAIKEGVITVIAGRPNAGKSTLLNALLQEERAIVSDIPGTTRDTIEEILVIKGIKFRLIDTAGIREAQDQIEEIGVRKTLEKVGVAAILVYVFDVMQMKMEAVRADVAKLKREGMEVVLVSNKWDEAWSLHDNLLGHMEDEYVETIGISAKAGSGLEVLKERLTTAAAGGRERSGDEIIISNVRHYQALKSAAKSLREAEAGILGGLTQELIALDIRHAIHHLGAITGEITTDEVLGNIFSKFCIGK